MKLLIDQSGVRIADLDEENRIVNGHHRVLAYRKMGREMFIKDGDTVTRASFDEDGKVTVH